MHEPINDVDVVQNQTATFTCAVSSEPVSTITWFLNGTTPVTAGGDHSITEASTTNTWNSTVSSVLTISNVQRAEDAGVYTCRAMNSVGTKDESANLTVQCMHLFLSCSPTTSHQETEQNFFAIFICVKNIILLVI